LLPFVQTALKQFEMRKCSLRKGSVVCGVAVFLSLAIALPVCLSFQYGKGSHQKDGWGWWQIPVSPFAKSARARQDLKTRGRLEAATQAKGLAKLGNVNPKKVSMIALAVALGATLFLAAARLRWTWWPIHPIFISCMWHYPTIELWFSFLLGSLVKYCVIKFGGNRWYNELKPLMLGLIAGDLLGIVIPAIVGAIYYFVTGEPPKKFMILPD
jgi:hypothetical protein